VVRTFVWAPLCVLFGIRSWFAGRKETKATNAWEAAMNRTPTRPTNTTDYLSIAKYCQAVDAATDAETRMQEAKCGAIKASMNHKYIKEFGPRWMWSYLPYVEMGAAVIGLLWMGKHCPDTLASGFNAAYQLILFGVSVIDPVFTAFTSINGEQWEKAGMQAGLGLASAGAIYATIVAAGKGLNYFSSVRVPRVPVDTAAIQEQLMDMAFTTTNKIHVDPMWTSCTVTQHQPQPSPGSYAASYQGILSRTDPNKLTAKERRWLRRNPPPQQA
jgi:hypothetical protein